MKKCACILVMMFMFSVLVSCGGDKTSSSGIKAESEKNMVEMIDVTQMSLSDALAELKATGFTNITSNASTDPQWDEDRWVVISQSIEPGKQYAVDDEIELTCKKKCLLYINLTSDSNLIFSTYGMEILLNEAEIGTVENGKTITKLQQVIEGNYTLTARKSGDNSLKATKELTVSSDMTFKSDIGHSGSSIEFKNMETIDGIVGASIKVPEVTGKVLREALTELEEDGFINVREEPYSDIWDKDNWIVTKQGVKAGSEVDQNEFIQLDCIKLDQYFNETYSGKTLAEVEKLASASGFLLQYVSDEDRSDLVETIKKLDEKTKSYWIVMSAEQYSAENKTAKVYLKYEGSPEEKKKAEEEKKKAEEEKKKAEEEKKKAEEEKKKAEEEKKKAEEAEKKTETANSAKESTLNSTEDSSQEIPEDDIPYNKVDSINVTASFAHAQFDSDIVYLGNGEMTTIYMTASPAGLTLDDFLIDYDDTILSVDIGTLWSDENKNQSGCTITVSAINPGVSDVVVYSSYDILSKGDEAMGYVVPVKALDSREGSTVYITRSGEKYHFSADCAGPNAEATTLHEAELYEYGPCGNCVN